MNPDSIPSTLTALPQWCVWKAVLRNGKLDKLPFQADGKPASSTGPDTWTTFAKATAAYAHGTKSFTGIGFIFSPDDDLCGIDLDGCRDKATGRVADWAREWIIAFDSYAEVSPSETGVKIFVVAKKPIWAGCKASVDAERMPGDKQPGIEIYDRGRYFAVTGRKLKGMPNEPQERQAIVERFCNAYFARETFAPPTEVRDFGSDAAIIDRARKYLAAMPEAVSGQDGHGRTYHAACVLIKGFGLSREHGMALLTEWNATHCKPQWSERELAHKIDSALKAPGEVNYLRLARPSDFGRIRVPTYSEPKPLKQINVTTLGAAALDYLDKLTKNGISLIETGLPDLDYALGGGVEAGEMVVIAARPSHGKSAVALQIVHHATLNGLPALIISEEMSKLALGKRAIQFASSIPREHWRTESTHVVDDLNEHFSRRAECFVAESVGTAEAAEQVIRDHVANKAVRLVVVDYAQLLRSDGKSRYEQVTNTSIRLRALASQLPIVLVVLCQLNRDIEKRPKFLPSNADLKDSGQIEQDADVIVHLCWPHRLDPKNKPDEFLLFIGKNRNREINESTLHVTFKPSRQMLVDSKAQSADRNYRDPSQSESYYSDLT